MSVASNCRAMSADVSVVTVFLRRSNCYGCHLSFPSARVPQSWFCTDVHLLRRHNPCVLLLTHLINAGQQFLLEFSR